MNEARVEDLPLPGAYTELGVVERAHDVVVHRARRGEQTYAIALAPPVPADDCARFRAAVRKLDAALAGPGHLAIADVLADGRVRAIVRPWSDGTAIDLTKRRQLLEAIALLDPVARALGRAHGVGAAHGALSPERIVATKEGAVIVDLAIAAQFALSRSTAYAAPEQLDPRPNVPKATTDVHALALLFIAAVAGVPPYGDVQGHDLYARVVDRRNRPSLVRHGVAAAPTIDRVLERALSVDPESRFADADTFWDALRAAVFASPETTGEPTRPRPTESSRPPPPKPARAPASIVIGASVAIIAIGFGAEAIVRAMKRPAPAPVASVSAAPSPIIAVPSTSVAPSVSASAPPPPPPAGEMVAITDNLLIDRTEVTVAAYRKCVEAGACRETYHHGSGYNENDPVRRELKCNYHRKGRDDHPVNCINFNQASAYCAFSGKRLPTSAEWTRAARGDEPRKYPWGDSMPRCKEVVFARYGPNNFGCSKQPVGTQPVESHPKTASPYGALDMAGSLWEWTTEKSPRGFAILRGGSWDSPESGVTIESRLEQSPGNADVTLGFRCVRDQS